MTVLSAIDPVRVFQQFATLDLLSHGRAEMVVGRGSFFLSGARACQAMAGLITPFFDR